MRHMSVISGHLISIGFRGLGRHKNIIKSNLLFLFATASQYYLFQLNNIKIKYFKNM